MQTIDEYFKDVQATISESRVVASTSIEYIKVLENEGYIRGILTRARSWLKNPEYVFWLGLNQHALKSLGYP
jgi:hypothetical protein